MKRKILVAIVTLIVVLLAGAAWSYHRITKRVEGEYFDSNGVRIHYTVEGKGEPLFLVHGFAANADANWRAYGVTQALAKEYQVVALDHRGHGLSEKPHETEKYGVEMCNDIARLMDHLKIQKAHVVGYSMGAFITLKFVTMYPDRLLSAGVCGAGWEVANGVGDKREEIAKSLENGEGFGPLFNAIMPPGKKLGRGGILSVDYVLSMVNDTKALASAMRSLDNLIVTEDQLRANQVPTISIVGTNDPLRTGVDRMKGVMTNHEIVYIDGTDHITTLHDTKFLESLRAFLKKHPATAAQSEAPKQAA